MTPSIDKILHRFLTVIDLDLTTAFDFLPNWARFQQNICNGCDMPTEDAYSAGHLVLSNFGTCMCSNVETNLLSCFRIFDFRTSLGTSLLLSSLKLKRTNKNNSLYKKGYRLGVSHYEVTPLSYMKLKGKLNKTPLSHLEAIFKPPLSHP